MAAPGRRRDVTFVVDPSMYGDGYAPPRDVYGSLERVVRPDLYYHYATPVCAQRWLDVCDDPEYGHGALLEAVRDVAPHLVEALRHDAPGRRRFHLCSLGPGDGSVDLALLEGLGRGLLPGSYTGLDFSFELLRRSVNRIAWADALPEELAVRAVCGDFTGLGSVTLAPPQDGALRLFALTGFTLGNYAEKDLLRDIGALMSEGDYLLLDARLHGFGPLPDDLAPVQAAILGGSGSSYDLPSVRRFVLGPVEVATTASVEAMDIRFEATRKATAVPNALNLLIYCTGLDAVMRLTGERVLRERLDLALTTAYHLPDLAAWLGAAGFRVVWQGERGDMAFFLLRR